MTALDPAREVLRRADQMRERAHALDTITTRIRLFGKPTQARRFLGFRATAQWKREVTLTPREIDVFYEWAMSRMREYEAEAARLDASVRVESWRAASRR